MSSLNWVSGNRSGTIRSNLIYHLVLSHVLKISPYTSSAVRDILNLIATRDTSLWEKGRLSLALFTVIIPLCSVFHIIATLTEVANLIEHILSEMAGILVTILSGGIVLGLRQRWCYQIFIRNVESVVGTNLWHRSRLILSADRFACDCEYANTQCRAGDCFKLDDRWFHRELNVTCRCFEEHVNRAIALRNKFDGAERVLVRGKRFSERKSFTIPSELLSVCYAHCGVLNATVVEERYDPVRLMWLETYLETRVTAQPVDLTTRRSNLDEQLTVHVNADEILDFVNRDYTPLIFRDNVKRGHHRVLWLFSVRAAVVVTQISAIAAATSAVIGESEAGKIAASVILLTVLLQALTLIKIEVDLRSEHGLSKESVRKLNIEMISSGLGLNVFSGLENGWNRHAAQGELRLGAVDWIDNLVINRTVLVGENVICLSRRGTDICTAKTKRTDEGVYRCFQWKTILAADTAELKVSYPELVKANAIC